MIEARQEAGLFFRRKQAEADRFLGMEQKRVAGGETAWPVYSGIGTYGDAFQRQYHERGFRSIDEWTQRRRQHNLPTNALDVMGGGRCKKTECDRITAVTLMDHHSKASNGAERSVAEGNIFGRFSSETWRSIGQGIPYDLVIARPQGGLSLSALAYHQDKENRVEAWGVELAAMYTRLRRFYQYMSDRDALGFFQTPIMIQGYAEQLRETYLLPWVEALKAEGVDILYSVENRDVFSLKKGKDSPIILPKGICTML